MHDDEEWTLPEVLLWVAGFGILLGVGLVVAGILNPGRDGEDRAAFFIVGGAIGGLALPGFVLAWRRHRRIERRRELRRRAADGAFRVAPRQVTGPLVEFTVGLAQRFGIRAGEQDPAADVAQLTLGSVSEWVFQTLEHDASGPGVCAQPESLGRVTLALSRMGADPRSIQLGTPLAQLIPRSKRRGRWKALGEALGVHLPPLPPYNAARKLLSGMGEMARRGAARALVLIILASPILLIVMLAAQVFAAYFPEGLSTVGQLTALVGHSGQRRPVQARWTPEQVWAQVRQTAADAFGVAESALTKGTPLAAVRQGSAR